MGLAIVQFVSGARDRPARVNCRTSVHQINKTEGLRSNYFEILPYKMGNFSYKIGALRYRNGEIVI